MMALLMEMPPPGLTREQAMLVARHRAGLLQVASRLAHRLGRRPIDVILLVASRESRLGIAMLEALAGTTVRGEIVVAPGRASELPEWIARIATLGPIVHCTARRSGVGVIIIDANDQMALVRLR